MSNVEISESVPDQNAEHLPLLKQAIEAKEFSVTLTFKSSRVEKENGGYTDVLYLMHSDCVARASMSTGEKVEVGGTIGAGYEVSIDGNRFYASPTDIWNAVANALQLERVTGDE